MTIPLKTEMEVGIMRRTGRVVAQTLQMVGESIRPGMTTADLDGLIEEFIRSWGAIPAFKGYRGFPASACISIDDEVVHGIPGKRVMREGEIVSVDVGSIVDGYWGDSARTYTVGEISPCKAHLMEVTRKSLEAAIGEAKRGNRLGAISAAVQRVAEDAGYGVVRELAGHGIGRRLHEEPQVPNFGPKDGGPVLEAGMVLAIEPMVNMGTHRIKVLSDGWTVVTGDGRPSAHFEHVVVIGADGTEVLTTIET